MRTVDTTDRAERRTERKYKVWNEVETSRKREVGFVWKRFLSPLPPFMPRFHPFTGASFSTIQHRAFIIPLKWSTFHSPTYVCSFKITMAAVWMEGMIHLLRHSVTVDRNQKHQGLAVFEKWLTLIKRVFFFNVFSRMIITGKSSGKDLGAISKSDSPLLTFLSVYLVLANVPARLEQVQAHIRHRLAWTIIISFSSDSPVCSHFH